MELDRRVADEQPTTWPKVVSLGVGVARAVLGEEPLQDCRPRVKGCERELSTYNQAVSRVSICKPILGLLTPPQGGRMVTLGPSLANNGCSCRAPSPSACTQERDG